MKLINLSSTSSNFRAVNTELHWDFSNLRLDGYTKIALSSMCLSFSGVGSSQTYPIFTNLINADSDNSEGIIACAKFSRQTFTFHSSNLEFWDLALCNPRDLLFTLPGIKTSDILFANIVLVIK